MDFAFKIDKNPKQRIGTCDITIYNNRKNNDSYNISKTVFVQFILMEILSGEKKNDTIDSTRQNGQNCHL